MLCYRSTRYKPSLPSVVFFITEGGAWTKGLNFPIKNITVNNCSNSMVTSLIWIIQLNKKLKVKNQRLCLNRMEFIFV